MAALCSASAENGTKARKAIFKPLESLSPLGWYTDIRS